jgi:hypothetical protein
LVDIYKKITDKTMKSTIAIIAFLMIICNIYAQQQPRMVKIPDASNTSMKTFNADSINNDNKNNADTSLTLNDAKTGKRAVMNYHMKPRAIPAKNPNDEKKDMIITKDTLKKPK